MGKELFKGVLIATLLLNFAAPAATLAHDWASIAGHHMEPETVERAVRVAERAQQQWVDRTGRSQPLAPDAHASAWARWLFAQAPARSGVDGPPTAELARAAGYPAGTARDAGARWRQDLRQVARLYDARQLDAAAGDGERGRQRSAYQASLAVLPASAVQHVAPVAERIAKAVAAAKRR